MTTLCMSAQPMWAEIGDLYAVWVNHRPLDQSIRLSLFLKQLSNAFDAGVLQLDFYKDAPAVETSDRIVVGEWRLAGNLEAFRAALKTPDCEVFHRASLDNSVEVAK